MSIAKMDEIQNYYPSLFLYECILKATTGEFVHWSYNYNYLITITYNTTTLNNPYICTWTCIT